ncbi:MAG: outer membrane protein assembly factor BamD [Candidatus Electrothrix sp. AR3]|nr:outer membrane protein assembly factor BamD [Candidatus Electrothrix sp. AR3]
MKGLKNIVVVGCSMLLLCQCASQDEIRKLNYQLRTVNQKVKKVESQTAQKMKEVESKTADQMLKRSASSSNKLDSVAEEARQLRAINHENVERFNHYKQDTEDKINSLYGAIEQMQTENDHLTQSNQELIQSLELKIQQLSGSLQQVSRKRVQGAEKKAAEAERRAREAAEKAAAARRRAERAVQHSAVEVKSHSEVKPEALTLRPESRKKRTRNDTREIVQEPPPRQQNRVNAAPPTLSTAESGLFRRGMKRFKAKKYKAAYKIFEQVLSSQPGEKRAAKTLYLMGECLFNLGEYDLAILEYQKVISNYSRNPHSSAALLRQGMSFEQLTDHETARIIYTKLTADYPDSREAKVAQERMENL